MDIITKVKLQKKRKRDGILSTILDSTLFIGAHLGSSTIVNLGLKAGGDPNVPMTSAADY